MMIIHRHFNTETHKGIYAATEIYVKVFQTAAVLEVPVSHNKLQTTSKKCIYDHHESIPSVRMHWNVTINHMLILE